MHRAWFPIADGHIRGLLAMLFLTGGAIGSPAVAHVLMVGGKAYPTLAAAIAAVPAVRAGLPPAEAIEIRLPSGVTRLTAPVVIDAAHGGNAQSRLILLGNADGTSRLSGAMPVPIRVGGRDGPPGAVTLDLSGVPGVPDLDRRGPAIATPKTSVQLFQGAGWLMPSRWPATGWATAAATGINKDGPVVAIPPDRMAAWRGEPDLWAAGHWGADWEYERVPVAALTGAGVRLQPLSAQQPVRPQVRFRIENAISALSPGHAAWLPARHEAIVLPTAGARRFEATVAAELLRIERASHVTIADVGFERSGGDAVTITGATDVLIDGCTVRQAGGNGLVVSGGERVLIRRTIVSETGERGVVLGGGVRTTLMPAHHAFVDGIVSDFGLLSPSYRPGIDIWGVGNRVSGSIVQRGDHAAILLSGNDHVVTDNEIRDVLRDTEDAGAVYMGADWTQRGHLVSANHIHALGAPGRKTLFLNGVYLDDQASGIRVTGNVVVGADYGAVIGGGRDNVLTGNLFVYPTRGGIYMDARGLDKQRPRIPEFARKLAAVPTATEPWRSHYPALAALAPADFGTPAGNVVGDNRIVGMPAAGGDGPRLLAGPEPAQRYLTLRGNRSQGIAGDAETVGRLPASVQLPGIAQILRRRVGPLQDRLRALSRQP